MNLLDCVVTKVLTKPYFKYEHWFIEVEFNSYGQLGNTLLMFKTKQEALNIKNGHKFLQ